MAPKKKGTRKHADSNGALKAPAAARQLTDSEWAQREAETAEMLRRSDLRSQATKRSKVLSEFLAVCLDAAEYGSPEEDYLFALIDRFWKTWQENTPETLARMRLLDTLDLVVNHGARIRIDRSREEQIQMMTDLFEQQASRAFKAFDGVAFSGLAAQAVDVWARRRKPRKNTTTKRPEKWLLLAQMMTSVGLDVNGVALKKEWQRWRPTKAQAVRENKARLNARSMR